MSDFHPRWAAVALAATLATVAVSAQAAGIGQAYTTGSFDSAGVIVSLSGPSGNESLTLEVKGPGDADFHAAHPFVRYDRGDFASSLFGLAPDTDYELRITLDDPDGTSGTNPLTTAVHTRPALAAPAPKRTRYVGPSGTDAASSGASKGNPYKTLQYAADHAQPGDEIRVLPGTYAPLAASGVTGTATAPIVLRADDPKQRPVIDAAGASTGVELYDSSYVWLDGFEVTGAADDSSGIGVKLNASSHLVVRNCFVHDNGHWNVLVTKSAQYSGGATEGGFHVIENNELADLTHGNCGGASNSACPGQTYYGIQQDNNPGGGNVIRNNVLHGNVDNGSICGDESDGRDLVPDTDNVLALTGSGAGWTNHDTEFSGNRLYDAKDDDLELDGICVNARVYNNQFGNAENPLSVAPALPGPYFILRNVITGDWGQAAIKMNTAGTPNSLIRNLYFYHNTIARSAAGPLLNLWFAVPGDHDVPIHNVVFRNNVFWAMAGGKATDANNQGSEQPDFDYDGWYTTTKTDVFEWYNGSGTDKYDSFAAFQTATGQEAHGLFADPGLDQDFLPSPSSAVVDQGEVIAGIDDGYAGAAPDMGAYEVGDTPAGGAGGTSTGGTGGTSTGGTSTGGTGTGGSAGAGYDPAGGSNDSGGCGCRTARGQGGGGALAALVLALVAGIRRRTVTRREARGSQQPTANSPRLTATPHTTGVRRRRLRRRWLRFRRLS